MKSVNNVIWNFTSTYITAAAGMYDSVVHGKKRAVSITEIFNPGKAGVGHFIR